MTQSRLTGAQQGEVEQLSDPGPLTEMLEALPAPQREAGRAYVLDDLGYDEIAAALAVQPATVRKRVSRGLAALRAATKETR